MTAEWAMGGDSEWIRRKGPGETSEVSPADYDVVGRASERRMLAYHRTHHSEAILREGFCDGSS